MSRLKQFALSIAAFLVFISLLSCQGGTKPMSQSNQHPVVVLTTSEGIIKIELYPDKAPVTVKNFLAYANERFYDGTIFHRVIPKFMIQGGGFSSDMQEKETHSAIVNEAGNGLKNDEGTVAMARTNAVNSATAQFFINVGNNGFLDHRDESVPGFGYAVFGKVVEGMDVVHKIENVPTQTVGPFQNVPVTSVIIKSARLVK